MTTAPNLVIAGILLVVMLGVLADLLRDRRACLRRVEQHGHDVEEADLAEATFRTRLAPVALLPAAAAAAALNAPVALTIGLAVAFTAAHVAGAFLADRRLNTMEAGCASCLDEEAADAVRR